MQPRPTIVTLGDIFGTPPFFGDPTLSVSRFLATSLLQLVRVPHKYALCHTALGSAPHLQIFKNNPALGPIARADAADLSSAGSSITRCLFELLERVWAPHIHIADLVYRSRMEMEGEALDPARFVLLSDEEYASAKRFVRYSDALKLHWTECWRLPQAGSLSRALVPAAFVYPGFGVRCPDECFVPMLSTGIAAGTRYDEAILHGLCEVVERDAFALAWLRLIPPLRIPTDASCLGAGARSVLRDLEADRFEVRFFDLTLDIDIPVAMAAITDRRKGEKPQTVLGLGCSPWPTSALEKALSEALQLMTNRYDFPGGIHVVTKSGAKSPSDQEVLGQTALAAFLANDDFSARFDVPYNERQRTRTPEKLISCIAELESRGFQAFFCDLTPREIAGSEQFCLVRVLVPGLQPHLYEPDCWRLAGSRVYSYLPARAVQSPDNIINRAVNPFAWEAAR